MTEAKMWQKIRTLWPGHAMRVEASLGGCDPGTPDANLSFAGHGGWVELKVWPEPLRETQLPWHIDAIQRGATALVWAWVGDDSVWSGEAETYQSYVEQNTRPKGQPLAAVVKSLVRILQ